jgi:ribosome-associated protein
MLDKSALKVNNSTTLIAQLQQILDQSGAINPVVLNIGEHTTIANHLVVATFSSLRQGLSLLKLCEDALSEAGANYHYTKVGRDSPTNWLVLDADTIIIHLLSEEARAFYNLEDYWQKRNKS